MAPAKCSSQFLPYVKSPGEGILSADPSVNPHFYNWRKIIIHYCSSDLYVGNNTLHSDEHAFKIKGEAIVSSVLDYLVRNMNLPSAANVIFSGSSAGTFGVIPVCKTIPSILRDTASFCVVDSGAGMEHVYKETKGCTEKTGRLSEQAKLFYATDIFTNIVDMDWMLDIHIPLFVIMNRKDFRLEREFCENEYMDLTELSGKLLRRVEQLQIEKVGVFILGCVGHVLLSSNIHFSGIKTVSTNVTLSDNLWSWISSHKYPSRIDYTGAVDTCEMSTSNEQCNPSCPKQLL